MRRKHIIFNEDENQESTMNITGEGLSSVTQDLRLTLVKLEEYSPIEMNFSSFYDVLHGISPKVFDLKKTVIFDKSIENFVKSHSKLSDEQVETWFIEYKLQSEYYNHLKEGVNKYNFWGHKSGVLTKEDIQEEIDLKIDNADDYANQKSEKEIASMTPQQYQWYIDEQMHEYFDRLERKSAKKKARNEGLEEGLAKGEVKGKIKGEISKVKALIKHQIPQESFISDLKFLTHDKVKDSFEKNISYIQGHMGDTDSEICDELGLIGDLIIDDFS